MGLFNMEKGVRYAVISDIHSNTEALETALNEIKNRLVDRIFCCGDITGYGPEPGNCLKLLKQAGASMIMGNHDAALTGKMSTKGFNEYAAEAVRINRESMSEAEISEINSLADAVKENNIFFTHGSPRDRLNEYLISERSLSENIDLFEGNICFAGHSHLPLVYEKKPDGKAKLKPAGRHGETFSIDNACRYIVNVGSIGQPRDGDPRACFVIYDTGKKKAEYVRLEYNIKATQSKMRELKLPEYLIMRIDKGR